MYLFNFNIAFHYIEKILNSLFVEIFPANYIDKAENGIPTRRYIRGLGDEFSRIIIGDLINDFFIIKLRIFG